MAATVRRASQRQTESLRPDTSARRVDGWTTEGRMNPRKLAKEAGEKLYQGSPCKASQHTERYTSSGACTACGKANLKDRYDNDPKFRAKAKAHSHKWYADHVELSTDRSKAYYKAHKDDPGRSEEHTSEL